jgi:hypothetical protein
MGQSAVTCLLSVTWTLLATLNPYASGTRQIVRIARTGFGAAVAVRNGFYYRKGDQSRLAIRFSPRPRASVVNSGFPIPRDDRGPQFGPFSPGVAIPAITCDSGDLTRRQPAHYLK